MHIDAQEGEHVTCLQWWNWRCGNQRKDYILAGKQNGALNVSCLIFGIRYELQCSLACMQVFRLAKLSAGLDPCFHLKLIEVGAGTLELE